MKNSFRSARLEQAPSLSSALVAKLREEIASERLEIGDPFPTEDEIAKAFGVSRTVVREAVAALRAEGLISTQRGRGSVVASRVPMHPFGISQEEMSSLDDILRVFELRSALETQAAALAAARRTDSDLESIRASLSRLDSAVARGEDGMEEDIELHLNIAAATHNDYFPRLLGSFRSVFIARRRVRSDLNQKVTLKGYLDIVQTQHHMIVEAIANQDVTTATEVMRKHLDGSRYRSLLQNGHVLERP